MALVTTKRNVDVLPGQAAPTVFHCSQHDVGATIILGLVNAGGNYSIPSGVTAIIQGSCSNGAVFTPVTATVSGSDITFNLSAEMTSIAGPTVCEAVLSKDTDVLGTANFILDVEPSAMGSDTPPVFADAAWLWMVDKMGTETVSALDDKTVIDAINEKADQSDVTALSNAKLDKNQGTANAGKYLKVGTDGNVTAEDLDVTTDKTLSITDKAADAKAVGDEITSLKADLNDVESALRVTSEAVVNVDTIGATVKTWAGLSKYLVVQKGAIQNKSGKVSFEFYNTSIHSSWAGYPFSFVLLQESNGKLVVVGVMSVPTPNIVGLVSVQTDWIVDSTKVYHIGMWRAGGSYVPYIASSVYGTYTKEIWASADEITVGSEILISSMSNVTGNTIVLNINISSDIGIEVDGIKANITGLDQQITDAREDIGDLSNLTNPASNLVDAINSTRGSVINLSNVPTDSASTWAGQSKGVFIQNIPIIKKSGLISLNFYNVSNHSSWAGYPFWFILYERTSAGVFTVVDKIAVDTPSTVGVFTVETGWQITDDKIYYVGVWRAAGTYIPYISGTIETIYKAGAYDTDADISAGSELGLAGLNFANTNTLVMNIFVQQDGKHTESGIMRKRTAHFSVDDAVFWSDLITNQDTYTSCFENAQLKMWKNLHDKYGICVTLNCFCSDGTNTIANVPNKFAAEFQNNANWLKFAFHAQDASTYYDTDNVDAITASYETFANGIITMTGITDAIDPVTRLGFYTGSLANVKAIRDASCGVSGLLTSDDVRNSYYLNAEQNAYIQTHDRYIDTTNQILFLHTMPRLETVQDAVTELATYDTANWQNKIGILEFFTHENTMSVSMMHRVETYCIWCILKGIDFDFACNSLYGLA